MDRELTTLYFKGTIKGPVRSCRFLFYLMHTSNIRGRKKKAPQAFLSLSIDRNEYLTQLKVINLKDGHIICNIPQESLVDLMEAIEELIEKLI